MKRILGMVVVLAAILIPQLGFAWNGAESARFSEANELYRAERFDEAIAMYEELSARDSRIPETFYNLGNAYYRKQEIGKSILAYERAQIRNPRNGDIRYNLKFVKGQLEYSIKDTRNWYLKAVESGLNLFTREESFFFALLSCCLFLASWLLALFFRPGLPWGWVRKSLLIIFVLSLGLAGLKSVQAWIIRDAIVTAKEAEVRFGPSATDQVAFRLGEGLKVYVVDHHSDWCRILLANGESGWVKNSLIAEVWVRLILPLFHL